MEQVLKYSTPRPSLSLIKPRTKKSKSPDEPTRSGSSSSNDNPHSPSPDSPRLGLSPLRDKKSRNESVGGDEALLEEQNRRKRMEDMRKRLNTDEVILLLSYF